MIRGRCADGRLVNAEPGNRDSRGSYLNLAACRCISETASVCLCIKFSVNICVIARCQAVGNVSDFTEITNMDCICVIFCCGKKRIADCQSAVVNVDCIHSVFKRAVFDCNGGCGRCTNINTLRGRIEFCVIYGELAAVYPYTTVTHP